MNSSDRQDIYLERPLSDARAIRILAIQPADDFDRPVSCTLRVILLDDVTKEYQTLSYAWGSSAPSKTIICDGRTLALTPTLELALRRIREKISSRNIFFPSIWIDAICIDQSNDLEKGRQIAIMGEIYMRSRRLIVWLDEASVHEVTDVKAAMKSPQNSKSADVLRAVCRRPWFQRLWVVQEVFRSPWAARHVLFGNFTCSFEALLESCTTAKLLDSCVPLRYAYIPEFFDDYTTRGMFNNRWSARNGDNFPSLLSNMIRFRSAKASQPHDRIYALLSISDSRMTVPIDYRMDLDSLSVNLAKRHADGKWVRQLLMCAATLNTVQLMAGGLPSWVPDWRAVEALQQSDPQKLQDLETDMFAENFDQLEDIANVVVKHGALAFNAVPVKRGGHGRRSRGYCLNCTRRSSHVKAWIKEQRSRTEAQNGRSAVLRLGVRTMLLIVGSGEENSERATAARLHSYGMLPPGIETSCVKHPSDFQRFFIR